MEILVCRRPKELRSALLPPLGIRSVDDVEQGVRVVVVIAPDVSDLLTAPDVVNLHLLAASACTAGCDIRNKWWD